MGGNKKNKRDKKENERKNGNKESEIMINKWWWTIRKGGEGTKIKKGEWRSKMKPIKIKEISRTNP